MGSQVYNDQQSSKRVSAIRWRRGMCPAAITALLFDENLKRAFSRGGGGGGNRRMEGSSTNGWSKVLLEKLEQPAVPISYRSLVWSLVSSILPRLSSRSFLKDSTRMRDFKWLLLEDGTMANKHVFTCGTKTFPRKKWERYLRNGSNCRKRNAYAFFSFSPFLSGWGELFNGIKH